MTFATSGYAQRYAVGRDDDAVLGGAVRAEDNGGRVAIHIQILLLLHQSHLVS